MSIILNRYFMLEKLVTLAEPGNSKLNFMDVFTTGKSVLYLPTALS